jgi:hypothetical protein
MYPTAPGVLTNVLSSYVTGKTVETAQTFNEACPEVGDLRTRFHEWLQMVYSKVFPTQSFYR